MVSRILCGHPETQGGQSWFWVEGIGIFLINDEGTHSVANLKANADGPKVPPYDRVPVAVCYAMRFTQFFILTNLET